MAEGLALATSGRFDLYLLDTAFADGSGIELARRIRAFDPETPPVFYSAKAFPAEVQEAMETGADAYITQPCDLMELYEPVKNLSRC
jgi:CheY-like chemotaxis protein